MTSRRLATLVALLVGACTTSDPDERVSIREGAYGLTTSGCDVADCEDQPYAGATVVATPVGGGAPVATTSDDEGFFELSLPPGSYELCVHSCTQLRITAGARLRRDFVAGPGGGLWCDRSSCKPGQ